MTLILSLSLSFQRQKADCSIVYHISALPGALIPQISDPMLGQERENVCGNLVDVRLLADKKQVKGFGLEEYGQSVQGKVSGVDQLHLRLRVVAVERCCTRRYENLIVLAPHGEGRWLILAEVRLEIGVESDIRLVIVENVQLDVFVARAVHIVVVQVVGLRRDGLRLGSSFDILKTDLMSAKKRQILGPKNSPAT